MRERKKSPLWGDSSLTGCYLQNLLPHTWCVGCSIVNRFVTIDVAISYFDVEITIRVTAHPGFVVYGRSLASEIGERQQVTLGTF